MSAKMHSWESWDCVELITEDNVLTGLVSQWRRVLTNIKIGVISVNTKQSQQQELGSFVKFVSYWCCLHNTFSD